jgi:hypothetical protein
VNDHAPAPDQVPPRDHAAVNDHAVNDRVPATGRVSAIGVGRGADDGPAVDRGRDRASAAAVAMDDAAHRELAGKLAAIKQDAYSNGIGAGNRPARTALYVHITDQTLLADRGVARVEGFGPALVARLSELLGHDKIVIQPVIDLNETVSVDAYEIPYRIREHIKLKYPVEQFPYGTAETGINTDLDHLKPYRKDGPPGQTSTSNLTPLGRLSHRIKTFGGWKVTRLDNDTLEWTTRHGFKLHVTQDGTYLVDPNTDHSDHDTGADPPEPNQHDHHKLKRQPPGKDEPTT